MKLRVCMMIACAVVAASAQERSRPASPRPATYDTKRETLLRGTVVSYRGNSPLPPIGAHVTVETSSGTVDVHLGPESYLRSNHFSLSAGDSVSFVGVSVPTSEGSVFLARVAQKGDQSMVIRSSEGFLEASTSTRTLPPAQQEQMTQERNPR